MGNCASARRSSSQSIAQQKHAIDKQWNDAISAGGLRGLEFAQATDECVLCFEKMSNSTVGKPTIQRPDEKSHRGVKLHCGHIHCSACLQKWFLREKKHTCPYCRTQTLARNTEELWRLRKAWAGYSLEVVRESALERRRKMQCEIGRQVALYAAEAARVRKRLLVASLRLRVGEAEKRLRWELEFIRREEVNLGVHLHGAKLLLIEEARAALNEMRGV